MSNLRNFISILLILNIQFSSAQIDSIEFNEGLQIYDFEIVDDIYSFRTFNNGQLIESDSLIFKSNTFFSNYSDCKPEYIDSIRFVIVSRTLTSYKEPILYDSENDFTRICWFADSITHIVRLQMIEESPFMFSKTGTGSFIRKGSLSSSKQIALSDKELVEINDLIAKSTLYDLHNIIVCPDSLLAYPLTFFIESKYNGDYNIFTVTECNFKDNRYKKVNKLFKIMKNMVDKTR